MHLAINRLTIVMFCILLSACSSVFKRQNPTGELFPTIGGQTLEKQDVVLPSHFSGRKTLLLLGYVQNAQFDIDRWLIGLDMIESSVSTYELPTIAGMFPRFFKTQIDNGMRKGIPKELWKGVITIYSDGETVQRFTGNENPNNARVILLDNKGEVIYFYDRGFSVAALKQLNTISQDTVTTIQDLKVRQ